MLDLNDAPEQRPDGVIPDGTYARMRMTFIPGGTSIANQDAADDGLFYRSKSGDSIMLNCEFVVLTGPYAKRRFWQYMSVNSEKGWPISKGFFRAMVDSAIGLDPKDTSDAAQVKRTLPSFKALDGIEFFGRVGIEVSPGYPDKNKLVYVVVPSDKEYAALVTGQEVPPKPSRSQSSRAVPESARQPAWGQQQTPTQNNLPWSASPPVQTPPAPAPAPAPAGGGMPAWLRQG